MEEVPFSFFPELLPLILLVITCVAWFYMLAGSVSQVCSSWSKWNAKRSSRDATLTPSQFQEALISNTDGNLPKTHRWIICAALLCQFSVCSQGITPSYLFGWDDSTGYDEWQFRLLGYTHSGSVCLMSFLLIICVGRWFRNMPREFCVLGTLFFVYGARAGVNLYMTEVKKVVMCSMANAILSVSFENWLLLERERVDVTPEHGPSQLLKDTFSTLVAGGATIGGVYHILKYTWRSAFMESFDELAMTYTVVPFGVAIIFMLGYSSSRGTQGAAPESSPTFSPLHRRHPRAREGSVGDGFDSYQEASDTPYHPHSPSAGGTSSSASIRLHQETTLRSLLKTYVLWSAGLVMWMQSWMEGITYDPAPLSAALLLSAALGAIASRYFDSVEVYNSCVVIEPVITAFYAVATFHTPLLIVAYIAYAFVTGAKTAAFMTWRGHLLSMRPCAIIQLLSEFHLVRFGVVEFVTFFSLNVVGIPWMLLVFIAQILELMFRRRRGLAKQKGAQLV